MKVRSRSICIRVLKDFVAHCSGNRLCSSCALCPEEVCSVGYVNKMGSLNTEDAVTIIEKLEEYNLECKDATCYGCTKPGAIQHYREMCVASRCAHILEEQEKDAILTEDEKKYLGDILSEKIIDLNIHQDDLDKNSMETEMQINTYKSIAKKLDIEL